MRELSGVFLGLSTVDLIFNLHGFPEEDTKNVANNYVVCAGGPASNAAITFAYLGGETTLVSSLGNSSLATLARREITLSGAKHIDLAPNKTADPALSAIIVSGDSGARTIITSPCINQEGAGKIVDFDSLSNATVLLFDGYEISTAVPLAKKAKESGKINVLDGDVYHSEIEKLLPFIDIVIYGQSFNVNGNNHISNLKEYFNNFGINKIIATRGHESILFIDGECKGETPVHSRKVVDTLGAGDIFHGAFCFFLGQGKTLENALIHAEKVAGISVGTFGTRKWMDIHKPEDFF